MAETGETNRSTAGTLEKLRSMAGSTFGLLSPQGGRLRGLSGLLGPLRIPGRTPEHRQTPAQKGNRAASVDVDRFMEVEGTAQNWANRAYGSYYASSVPVYSAIRVRSEALARPPVVVYRSTEASNAPQTAMPPLNPPLVRGNTGGTWLPVTPTHPVQRLLDKVNPWLTRGELWRATEIYLSLWGSAFWALERDDLGQWELWPLRPDRVRVLPDRERYIRGYVYMGALGPVPYTAAEMVWVRYFNPLEEFAGLSPLAPLRLSADMGLDATRFNRNFFKNSAQPDLIFTTEETMSDEEVEEFYQRWENRYKGPGNAHRPAIANFIKDIKTLGMSHREMEFIQGLRWSLEDVSRTYGVPLPLLSDFQRATFSNVNAAERFFWRNTMVPEMLLLEEQLNEKLLPLLGYPDLRVEFDLTAVEALQEDQTTKVDREMKLLDRGVLTINEVRRRNNLPDVPWGDIPHGK